MPKKRHWARYTKPQTTAPHSLESSGRQSNIHHHDGPQDRSVNNLLASLRKASLTNGAAAAGASGGSSAGHGAEAGPATALPTVGPTVPPEIAHILLPGQPAPLPAPAGPQNAGRGRGGGAAGPGGGRGGGPRRRPPPGPAAPPSWLSQSRHAPRQPDQSAWQPQASSFVDYKGINMPGVSIPERGSFVDMLLRKLALDWEFQKHYNQYHLTFLQGSLKAALISFLSSGREEGVSIADLRALLQGPEIPPLGSMSGGEKSRDDSNKSDDNEDEEDEGYDIPSPSTLNEDVRYLDLSGSIGHFISFKELADLLFNTTGRDKEKGTGKAKEIEQDLLESWDTVVDLHLPRPLLPTLTHLSLSLLYPQTKPVVSWRHLLSFASHLPTLTHLSLAYWPEPSLTPNAKFATVVSPLGLRMQYGGTGPYSHSLENDWSEAIMVVRKLSKALYGLEYLDLTGCSTWFPALMNRAEHDQVDWVGDWGKVATLVLCYGATAQQQQQPDQTEPSTGELARLVNAASEAQLIERHIRNQRQGRGRFITVIGDRPTK